MSANTVDDTHKYSIARNVIPKKRALLHDLTHIVTHLNLSPKTMMDTGVDGYWSK